jgi:serine protease DegQ
MNPFYRTLAPFLLMTSVTATTPGSSEIALAIGQGLAGPSLAPLLKTVTPSVVSISVRKPVTEEERELLNDPMLPDHDQREGQAPGESNSYAAASGVVIDAAQGFVVTAGHVVDGATEMVVVLADGSVRPATLVGLDAETDIAVVRVPPSGLTAIRMGDSDRTQVGDFVLAIGNPFNIGQTVTSGIVSALRRRGFGKDGFEDLIQTDAAINLGSSGGALINLRGEMIGMNAAILYSGDVYSASVGIGFAVPVNTVRGIANQLIKHGAATHGELGVAVALLQTLPHEKPSAADRSGVVVTRVVSGSSAARAGLQAGDLIKTFNSLPVRDPVDLQVKSALLRVGDVVELWIVRRGQAFAVSATLDSAGRQPS